MIGVTVKATSTRFSVKNAGSGSAVFATKAVGGAGPYELQRVTFVVVSLPTVAEQTRTEVLTVVPPMVCCRFS